MRCKCGHGMTLPTRADADQILQQAQGLFLQGRIAAARALVLPVLAAWPEHVDCLQLTGLIAQQERDLEGAQTLLTQAAALAPARADVRSNLGSLLRVLGCGAAALAQLEHAARLAPDNGLIQINLGLVQQDLGLLALAEVSMRQAVAIDPESAAAHQNLGHLLMLSDLQQSRRHLIRALQLQPGLHAAFKDLCAVLISSGEPTPALRLCEARLRSVPDDQDAIAMMALALRDVGQVAQADRLVDCATSLRCFALAPPPAYDSIVSFNAALLAHVLAHPRLTAVLHGNATHHGKRINDLLAAPLGPVALLQQMILAQIGAYRQAQQDQRDCDEQRHVQDFETASDGNSSPREQLRCWAVLMHRNGHETPHLHPDGRISGVYYVALPDVMNSADTTHAGWIEFGQPDPSFATRSTVPTLPVQPQAGQMLLFPSYFWHRTIPFQSDQPRLSIAFDLCPLAAG